MKKLKPILTALILTVVLTAGATYAWSTTQWWGTDWINDGEEISAQKIAENFEYLKNQIDNMDSRVTIIENNNNTTTVSTAPTACTQPTDTTIGGRHTKTQCESAGGTFASTSEGCLCKLSPTRGGNQLTGYTYSCPAGWSQHQSWSTTSPYTFISGNAFDSNFTCTTTGYHGFNNMTREFCTYRHTNPYSTGTSMTHTVTFYANYVNMGCK